MSMSEERLRRLLLIIPYVSKHPGVSLPDLAEFMGITVAELEKDLGLLMFVGHPPFDPGDLIDLDFESGRCFVTLDQRFTRPPRLTISEAAALWAAAEVVTPIAGTALDGARRKLAAALPRGAQRNLETLTRQLAAGTAHDAIAGRLQSAIERRLEVELEYLAAGRERPERRRVRPRALILEGGHWYLHGWCLSRDAERQFRLDRILGADVTDRRFDHAVSPAAKEGDAVRATIRFSPIEAPRIRERFGERARPLPDGGAEVEFADASVDWIVSYVFSFAGEAEVLEPTLRAAVHAAIRERRSPREQ